MSSVNSSDVTIEHTHGRTITDIRIIEIKYEPQLGG